MPAEQQQSLLGAPASWLHTCKAQENEKKDTEIVSSRRTPANEAVYSCENVSTDNGGCFPWTRHSHRASPEDSVRSSRPLAQQHAGHPSPVLTRLSTPFQTNLTYAASSKSAFQRRVWLWLLNFLGPPSYKAQLTLSWSCIAGPA